MVVTPEQVKAATKTTKSGYSGDYLPRPKMSIGEVCEDCTDSIPHKAGSADDVLMWRKGERKMYDSDSGDGIHTFAELMEIEDDMKHAYD